MEHAQIKFLACAPPHCKCPEVIYDGGEHVTIKDDWEAVISMTPEQLDILAKEWLRQRQEVKTFEDGSVQD